MALVLFLLLSPLPAFAVNPDEVLPDPALEARARALSAQLRCMVCQNQSIDDSNAELARDLRVLVRERIVSGDSDEAVIDYVVSRYGEFVLLKPRLRGETLLLWGAPIVLFLGGAVAMTLFVRRRAGKAVGEPLTVEEKAALDRIVGEGHAKSVGSEK
ncbi:cytochrome c-type biogenesis protein [Mycoplana azooxidifex]|uniref:cytochrome c-type biogenesis protein n=1 Tax=Mycoplana azooxidifex TaxID=1636188 RepID=UPI001FE73146|nr:cytochrome c-type biogenesis protein [Mycoplana azooxidifex]